jgi:3-dehydroquinate dehydratase II
MKIQIINGPNLNLLGKREPSVYGGQSFDEVFGQLKKRFSKIELHYYQSNVEGEIIDKLHEVGFSFDGIVLNAGAYTHTSVAIHDAIAAIKTPVAEVHISNVYAREEFRHLSLITSKCIGLITGFGMEGYAMAIDYFQNSKPSAKA